jgi:hypothetical protein
MLFGLLSWAFSIFLLSDICDHHFLQQQGSSEFICVEISIPAFPSSGCGWRVNYLLGRHFMLGCRVRFLRLWLMIQRCHWHHPSHLQRIRGILSFVQAAYGYRHVLCLYVSLRSPRFCLKWFEVKETIAESPDGYSSTAFILSLF